MTDRDTLEAVYAKALTKLETLPNWSDVTSWADAKLGIQLWSVQDAIAASVQSNPRTAVWSCHDSGKSFLAAVLTCHHIDTHRVREARVITTAPSGHQVRGVLWVEINGLFERAGERGTPLPGRVNQTEWWIGSYQAGVGRKPNEYNADQFAGFHARYPLVILDEADGLPIELWEGIEALLTNRKARLFCIGNPLDASSEFARIRKAWENGDDTYAGITIPYTSTPNFSGEDVSEYVKDVMLSQEWVETKRRAWGDTATALADPTYQPLENPYWWGRVLAEYPPEDASTIISAAALERNRDEDEQPHAIWPGPIVRQLGVDIAASDNGDYTVARERVGKFALREWRIRSDDDDKIADFIVEAAEESQAQLIVMDGTGVGFGFTGRVRQRVSGRVVPIQFAGRSTVMNEDKKTRKFENIRAELYWECGRESLRKGEWNLAYADNLDEVITDLTAARLDTEALSKKQIIKVEEKALIKKRLKRSPDSGEALLLAYFQPHGGGIATMHSPAGRRLPTGSQTVVGSRPTVNGQRRRRAAGR